MLFLHDIKCRIFVRQHVTFKIALNLFDYGRFITKFIEIFFYVPSGTKEVSEYRIERVAGFEVIDRYNSYA